MMFKEVLGCVSVAFSLATFAATTGNLLYYSTLNDDSSITVPTVGPSGTKVSGTFVAGKRGNALQVPGATDGARVVLPAGTLNIERGTIEFWGRFDKGEDSYGGHDLVFFALYKNEIRVDTLITHLEVTTNGGLGNSGLFSLFCGANCSSYSTWSTESKKYSDLFTSGAYDDWHHYALVWDTAGISGLNKGVALYVDGKVHATATWVLSESDKSSIDSLPVTLCIGRGEAVALHSLDEFKIWDCAKTDFNDSLYGSPVVSGVTAGQHYPWNGKVDIRYAVAGPTDGLVAKAVVRDQEHAVAYDVKTFTGALSAAVGTHEIVWDATADGVNLASTNLVATVSLIVGE